LKIISPTGKPCYNPYRGTYPAFNYNKLYQRLYEQRFEIPEYAAEEEENQRLQKPKKDGTI